MPTLQDFDAELPYGGTGRKLAERVGEFVAAWGIVERELDTAVPVVFHTDPTLACCIYANLGTKAKLDMLTSAISMQQAAIGGPLTQRAHKTIELIRDLCDRVRNTLAHGQVHLFRDTDSGRPTWELVRHVARKNHAMVIYPGDARYWGAQARSALRLAQKWRTITAQIYARIGEMTLEELDRICVTEVRYAETRPPNRRSRPVRPKGAFEPHQAKRAKWPQSPKR